MEKYDGIANDSIKRGGSYNNTAIGHEVCNFTNNQDIVYGYVQPTGQIKIEKLGAKKSDDSISDITVVWLAGPESGGTAVVGWYKNATVYRDVQDLTTKTNTHVDNKIDLYRIKANYSDATLLPIDKRTLMIPRAKKGGIGQSNVWYADAPESAEIVERVKKLIFDDTNNQLRDIDEDAFDPEGNPRLRAHIIRERNPKIIKAKKEKVLKDTGALKCEVCKFDFKQFYGEIGKEFCEVHHLIPLHKSDGIVHTNLADLAIICSNCHRIIHRTKPMLSIEQLRGIIKKT